MQSVVGPNVQHSVPAKQSSGLKLHPSTKHPMVTKVSQKVASVPAQSSGVEQDLPKPTGARWQIESALQA
jgi:hypothetical protein